MSGASRTEVDRLEPPPGYEGWAAARKAAWLWDEVILATAYPPSGLPPLRLPFQARPLAEIGVVTRRRHLEQALTRTGDLMAPGRPKVIHALGTVAPVTLDTDPGSPFTGLLSPPPEGGAGGLIRLSLVARVVGKAAYTPAFGLKLLVDHRPSADVLAMNHVVGQGRDFDLFSNSMTNDLSDEHRELRPPQRIMARLFQRVSHRPRRLVSSHLAEQRRDGSAVADPETPRRLVFHPTDEARQVFLGQAGVDFRRVLTGVAAGTPLYAVDGLTADGPRRVGTLRTTGPFVASAGGERLFFRHVQDPADRRTGAGVRS